MSRVTGTKSLERAMAILREVAVHDARGVRLTDVAGSLGLDTSTAHRLLGRLVAEGMLARDARGRYRLGPVLYEFGQLASHRFTLPQEVPDAIQWVADDLGDSTFLTVRSGLDAVCLARCEGSFPIKVVAMIVGTRRLLGVGSSGVALLAAIDREEAAEIIAANAARYLQYGSASVARVRHRVDYARRVGYAVTESYLTRGVGGIGVAVPNPGRVPVYALSMIGLSSRLKQPNRDRIVSRLRELADAIAGPLGRR